MKKRIFAMLLTTMAALTITACGGDNSATKEEVPAQPPVLTGEWKQVNSNSEDTYHVAVIQDDTIEINWVMEEDDTKALYWAGTFVAPETADEPYTWDSENDKEKTDMALLASGDETKTFTYENGQLSYDASMMGVTQTVKLEKVTE